MTILDTTDHRSAVDDYTILRTSVGVYPITAPLARISGDNRFALLDQFLSKGSDFVEPETVRECLALNADGSPFALLLHLETGDETWLLPRTPVTAEALRDYLTSMSVPAEVTVEVAPQGWAATAFEGPQAWSVAAHFVDFDISGLTLHAIASATVPYVAATAYLARVGTTGEYGYLLLSDSPEAAHNAVLSSVTAVAGAAVAAEGLARVQAEAGTVVYHLGLGGLSVNDADLAWMIDWDRVGAFHGSAGLVAPTIESARLTTLAAAAASRFDVGAEITAGGVAVGSVIGQAPSANPDEELVIAVLDAPMWVPGLDLAALDARGAQHPLRTVSLPRVLARSSHTRID